MSGTEAHHKLNMNAGDGKGNLFIVKFYGLEFLPIYVEEKKFLQYIG